MGPTDLHLSSAVVRIAITIWIGEFDIEEGEGHALHLNREKIIQVR